jgi:GT2 family glycosyltransferase
MGVAVVSYNTAALLRRCLHSIVADTNAPMLVVDNGSDGSADIVRREFPTVRVRVEENRGYGAAANIAVTQLETPYVLLLNADTELTPRTLQALTRYLDQHPRVAIAGPRIVNAAGVYERSAHHFPTPTSLLLHARWWPGPQSRPPLAPSGQPSWRRRVGSLLGSDRHEWRARRVDWVLGAALAIRQDAFTAVGGFDEAYFLYQEEIDLCYRLRAEGWEVHYAPTATVLHVGGASTSQRAIETFAQFVRSTQRFARLRFTRARAIGVQAVLGSVLLSRLALETARLASARDGTRRDRIRERAAAWRRGLAVLRERSEP